MTIINEWVRSEWSGHFKHRKELHHIYKLDEDTLCREFPHLKWCFYQFPLNGLDNQTMTFKPYTYGRETYNFFRLSDTRMVMIHHTHSGNSYIRIIRFHRRDGKVSMELSQSYTIETMSRSNIQDLRTYIKKYSTPKKPENIYKRSNFNFISSQQREFEKLKGDKRKSPKSN